jgi:hypothetical protein
LADIADAQRQVVLFALFLLLAGSFLLPAGSFLLPAGSFLLPAGGGRTGQSGEPSAVGTYGPDHLALLSGELRVVASSGALSVTSDHAARDCNGRASAVPSKSSAVMAVADFVWRVLM